MTPRRTLIAFAIALSQTLAGPPAMAAFPSAAHSTVDPCLRVCPIGDMNVHVVVRDFNSDPIPFSTVAVDLCACPGVILCPPTAGEPYSILGCQVVMTANAAGVADIPIRAGGVCSGSPVHVYANGAFLATRTAVISPDQSGDATVNANDQTIFAAKLGGPFDPTADLDCSGAVDVNDGAILGGHLGHACGAVVPALPKSWGLIKSMYYR
ncbi:MAG: hypothetical protein ACRENJ_09025 [Candidatus Eiseniibacteriota bacterium]